MKISEIRSILNGLEKLVFQLPDGSTVPNHFHVTEIGAVTRHFIDCGGTERIEKKINFQLWEADDFDHRLAPEKLSRIIDLSINKLGLGDLDVEVEYQKDTIGKYNLQFDGNIFQLTFTKTACLAEDSCGIPASKTRIQLQTLGNDNASCTPGGGCF
ncbi:MAG: DUF6428 family protein [Crocinitomicaceae bacterium]|nr:DUF6428 family protein [Crocinitomicaceae bacterium]